MEPNHSVKRLLPGTHYRHIVAVAAIFATVLGITLLPQNPALAATTSVQEAPDADTAKSIAVLQEFLGNTSPDKVVAAAQRLVADDATFISLNFNDTELKNIEPWAGTGNGPKAFSSTFIGVAKYWKVESFSVTDMFGSGQDVAVFGAFELRSKGLGKLVKSPFSIHAKVKDGKIVYFQFMEDTYASASSFRQSGSWIIKNDPLSPSHEVGQGK
ncbi:MULTISPECIES: nuclear transport factor 2 family protein [unclassified Pseudomonas]|uniref:nuclear transport factor 2 family protein n=1 Tax=unclassified Pseudomonas TaxID=196821 RepID=UPI002114AADC|nr:MULTISPECIES: nuclear transport factor 2 family protein [unclassified Pseudomonas]MCU1737982.1 nuclear transport factor 2 family protein [Pseudomonas sp. 20S_6.2_Bac1]